MMRILPERILAAAFVLIVALTGLVLREEYLRQSGREVLLAIEAVDPRDLLSGHYVDIRYAEPLDADAPCPPGAQGGSAPEMSWIGKNPAPGQWIALVRKGDHDVAAGAALSRAQAAALGPAQVRGHLTCRVGLRAVGSPPRDLPGEFDLDLGAERFHADQKQAQAIVGQLRQEAGGVSSLAVVSVGSDGKARLKGLIVGGQRLTLSWY